jgi:nitroimidazol reductase NimA-like FMN-containing flavoprotein (pyridoxamine 5'-phosphate oxidase superfamily)
MADPQPTAELLATTFETYEAPTSWEQARQRLEQAHDETYWLATSGPAGRPHVRPILGVWVDGSLHFASGATTAKTRILASKPKLAVMVARDGIDLVVEGEAVKVDDEARLRRVAAAYQAKYDWQVTLRDGAFHDAEGAPTAGPPPYEVYAVRVVQVFGFPTGGGHSPTRWRFAAP